jgi:transcriptional regulator with XRE-family HTH domain
MDRPPVPPDAALIRLAREGAGISVASAAEAAGMSKSRWVQIENGQEKRQGLIRATHAKPVTIARMAHALRITPERLESEGQRPDAAEILREILHREVEAAEAAAPAALPVPGEPPGWMASEEARTAANRPYADQIRGRLNLLRGQGITSPSGDQLFPDSPADARLWDKYADDWEDRDVVWFIADLQRRADGRNRPVNTG